MQELPIHLLRSFATVAKTLNLSNAAQLLHKAPSTLSMQLSKLEDILDAKLIERGQYGVRLTSVGKQLEQDALKLINLHDQIIGNYQHGTVNGTVRLGTHDQYATRELPPILETFVVSFPEANLEVHVDHRPEVLINMLEAGKLDIALVEMPAQSEGGERLAVDELVWVKSKTHILEPHITLPLAVFIDGCYHRQSALNALKTAGVDYRIAYSTQSRSGILAAVKAGIGIGVIPRASVGSDFAIIEEGLPKLPLTNVTLFHADKTNEATERLAAAIRTYATDSVLQ